MTRVELAEGKLLNEIHEHISLGITMALDALISAAHAEGVEEERERILASGRRIDRDECTDGFAECDEFVCPYSLIAPKEKP
jgi:hypothetical protein